MIGSTDWRRTFPSSAAAEHVREYLTSALRALEGAQIGAAIELLGGSRWRDEIDMEGVPEKVLSATQSKIDRARSYLREKPDPDITSAKDEVMDALALWAA